MAIELSNKTYEELEKEAKEANLIPKNTICDFEIVKGVAMGSKVFLTEDRVSSSNNDMIQVILCVFYNNKTYTIIDYLMGGKMEFKLRQAMRVCGVDNPTASAFIGKAGKVKIGIQVDKSGKYPDKNNVLEYITAEVVEKLDDSIPF